MVIDFRGFDTLVEIAVFGMAGLGVYTLLRYAARQDWQRPRPIQRRDSIAEPRATSAGWQPMPWSTASATNCTTAASWASAGTQASPFVRVLAHILLPVMLVLAAVQMMYGHDQAGDGFTAGVIISLAIAFWYVVFGYQETRRRLPWLRPFTLIGAGLLLVILDAAVAAALTGHFLANLDYGKMFGLSLPRGFALSTSFIFEVAICLTVLGRRVHDAGGAGASEGCAGGAVAGSQVDREATWNYSKRWLSARCSGSAYSRCLRRNVIRSAIGLIIISNAVNLFLLSTGAYQGAVAAYANATGQRSDALPQALVLTADRDQHGGLLAGAGAAVRALDALSYGRFGRDCGVEALMNQRMANQRISESRNTQHAVRLKA